MTLFGYWHRIRYASVVACTLVERTSALRWNLRPVAGTPRHHEIDQFERLGRSLVGHERDLWTLALWHISRYQGEKLSLQFGSTQVMSRSRSGRDGGTHRRLQLCSPQQDSTRSLQRASRLRKSTCLDSYGTYRSWAYLGLGDGWTN